jgi:hypothetical protein
MNNSGNIEHSTFNAQYPMNDAATLLFTSMFNVECSMLSVSPFLRGGML